MRFILVLLSVFFVSCQQNVKGVTSITVADLQTEIAKNKDIQLLDVRTPKEWKQGVIKGAIKVNVLDANFSADADKILSKGKPVYVYCRSGRRSLKASKILAEKGYQVYNIIGGYKAWRAKVFK